MSEKTTKYTNADLKEMQSWPLERKIQVTQTRILEFGLKFNKQIYVSFSGGKDSTVLLDLVRRVFPDTPAVFIDTGLEYPEIREFVKTIPNVEILKPLRWDKHQRKYIKTNFREVIRDYGYPLISKEQAAFIQEYRDTNSEKLKDIRLNGNKYGKGKISKRHRILIDAPFRVSDMCCDIMKKNPAKQYEKQTGRYPVMGTMAEESDQRKSNWLMYGCNAFDAKRPNSRPMSFWTEQDVLKYLKEYNLPYASVYGAIERERERYYTTGCQRTGCVFCGFGCHFEKEPNRFQRLKQTHPKLWEYCMKPWDKGGLGMKEVLEYIGVKIE